MSNWYLQNGKESDVVLSTRIRLARNIKEFEFCHISINTVYNG